MIKNFTLRLNDRAFEATTEGDGVWQVNYPEGGFRFAGSKTEVEKEIARVAKNLDKDDEE